jgi:hypothetical protein
MKRSLIIIGVLLALLMVGNGCCRDHERKNKSEKKMEFRHLRGRGPGQMGQYMGRGPMRGMRGGMGMGEGRMGQMMGRPAMNGTRGNNMGMPMYGMRRGMAPMGIDRPGFGPMAPGRFLDRLPNITDKQKKEIAGLRQKQMDEMMKFREETAAKMKSMREANKAKMMNLLTDEQKKFLESRTGINPTTPPASEKK